MKLLFLTGLLAITHNVFATDCDSKLNEIKHQNLDSIIVELSSDNITTEKADAALLKYYYVEKPQECYNEKYPFLDYLSANNISVDNNNVSIYQKMKKIGEIISKKSLEQDSSQVSDFMYHEYGCLMGGSC
jgi:hypothetical protein